MPLSFNSENHGNIAFGFFNIESDMLLLEKYFFFADMFCQWMVDIAREADSIQKSYQKKVYHISDTQKIGDLMGAIHGVHFTGFIGDIYKKYPFPIDPIAFKQNPYGFKTQKVMVEAIEAYAQEITLEIEFKKEGKIFIGPYQLTKSVFHELLDYVWQGGYPKWKDNRPPSYVLEMTKQLHHSYHPFFK